jgi:hypothetical protein
VETGARFVFLLLEQSGPSSDYAEDIDNWVWNQPFDVRVYVASHKCTPIMGNFCTQPQ